MSDFFMWPPCPWDKAFVLVQVPDDVWLTCPVPPKVNAPLLKQLIVSFPDHAPAAALGRLVNDTSGRKNLVHLVGSPALRRHGDRAPETPRIIIGIAILAGLLPRDPIAVLLPGVTPWCVYMDEIMH